MDLVLELCEQEIYTPYLFPSYHAFPKDSLSRQLLGLTLVVIIGGYLLYLIFASLSFLLIYDKTLMKHPLYLKNQIKRELTTACISIIPMAFLTIPFFLLEIRGYSKLYVGEETIASLLLSIVSFILFTDCLIYWIHRVLHTKYLYKTLHKVHHTWKVPSPFASHAFHPLDGFLQSVPYHIYVFLFPMNKYIYLGMFVFVNLWTISIHDGDYRVPRIFKELVNGARHHTDHHLFYSCNYGQFFTLWDRIGGSFRDSNVSTPSTPSSISEEGNDKKIGKFD